MPKCLVPGCSSSFEITGRRRELSFFQVPDAEKNPRKWKMAEAWLDFCGLNIHGFQFGTKQAIICEKHFLPEDMEILYPRKSDKVFKNQHPPKRVKFGAVPKIRDGCIMTCSVLKASDNKVAGNHDEQMKCENYDSNQKFDGVLPNVDKPLKLERQEAAELARWPPDVKIPVAELNTILTCGICKGYFYNATTITECLHTFCKSCLVKHFYRSLSCPTCGIIVHPSDPFVNIKPDAILQDIVYKIFPQRLKDDQQAEAEFYSSQGLSSPKDGKEEVCAAPSQRDLPVTRMVSLRLDYAGTTPSLPPHQVLKKNFLRIPNTVTVGQIIKFLRIKLCLPLSCQAALFINCFMLSENLKLSRLEEIFGEQIQESCSDMLFLQYGVIPKGNYFDNGLVLSTKYL